MTAVQDRIIWTTALLFHFPELFYDVMSNGITVNHILNP